jgi:predicted dehydrogenase
VADLSQVDYTKMVNLEPLQVDETDALRAQLDSFVDAVVNRKRPQVDAYDGLAAVALARRIVESMVTQTL